MAVLALGIVMTVVSGTVMNCGEAVVQAVVRKTGARFGTVKVGFDLACAALACLCAFLFVGHLAGRARGHLRLRRLHRRHRERLHGPLRASWRDAARRRQQRDGEAFRRRAAGRPRNRRGVGDRAERSATADRSSNRVTCPGKNKLPMGRKFDLLDFGDRKRRVSRGKTDE